ncbi:hypothetical protein NSI01_46070 [Pimelobacter simplex]|nr:hypothetical protein NSI01_46070 [Pimelobacter simplex]
MESARVRGCVAQAGREPVQVWQADASRRRNGPRKPAPGSVITVRLSRQSCLGPDVRYVRLREKVSSGNKLREPQQAGVGEKTRSAGRNSSLLGASASSTLRTGSKLPDERLSTRCRARSRYSTGASGAPSFPSVEHTADEQTSRPGWRENPSHRKSLEVSDGRRGHWTALRDLGPVPRACR